jgi:GDP-4-dehydro-6-deoxy-D-mannose reductase
LQVLVTGITGFVGGHLADHLLAENDEVTGCSRSGSWPPHLKYLADRVRLVSCDLSQPGAAMSLFDHDEFDVVYHLAAVADPRVCATDPSHARRANVLATERLYDAIVQAGQRPEMLFVSTAYVYGHPRPEDLPIQSTAPICIDSEYAATKWQAEQISVRFAAEHGLSIRRVRTFNHVGPRQPAGFIVADWARQVALIEAGKMPAMLRVGNIESRRDYSDVRDIVRAYRLLAASPGREGMSDVFNLGSGVSRSGREILDGLQAITRSYWDFEIDPDLLRPGEAAEIVADATPLRRLTGWSPRYNLHQTLSDTLDYWRSVVQP